MQEREVTVLVEVHSTPEKDLESERIVLQEDLRAVPHRQAEVYLAAAPPNAKGSGAESSQLLLTLLASGGVLSTLITAISSFVAARSGRSVSLEIKGDKLTINGADDATLKRVTKEWIARHKG